MKEVKRNNVVINYQVAGDGENTLLFVHGSFINQEYWKDQVSYFSSTYKVVTLDLPGHGKSGRNRNSWTFKEFGKDVYAVIKELSLRNIILIGHSMGCDVDLVVATSHPAAIIGFIGIDYYKNAATAPADDMKKQEDTILQNLKTDFANTNEKYVRMALVTQQTPTEIINRVVVDYRNAYAPMGVETTREVFKSYQHQKELLPLLKLKLYLINVDYKPTNEEPLKQYTGQGYELVEMKGTCHFPMMENPQALNTFLDLTIQKILADL